MAVFVVVLGIFILAYLGVRALLRIILDFALKRKARNTLEQAMSMVKNSDELNLSAEQVNEILSIAMAAKEVLDGNREIDEILAKLSPSIRGKINIK